MKIETFLNSNPLAQTFLTSQLIEKRVRTDLSKLELSFMQALILVAIFFENDKTTTPSNLKTTFGLSKSNVTHILTKLQEAGLLSRKTESKDSRLQPAKLTATGEKVCTKLIRYFDSIQTEIEKNYNGETRVKKLVEEIKGLTDYVGCKQ